MKSIVVFAALTLSLCVSCNAKTLKHTSCDATPAIAKLQLQRPDKACPVLRLAADKRCSCITYSGTRCTGPCLSAGKPYGCNCK